MENSIRAKYSNEPNDNANFASAGAKNARQQSATIPPKNEDSAQTIMVDPAFPCCASG
jgi:hypothetical protein